MADETRKVTAELEFTKSGDEGAFKEAAADVRELDTAADQSQGGLDTLARKEKDAAGGARELATGTREAGSAAAEAAPKIDDVGTAGEAAAKGARSAGEGMLELGQKVATALPAIGAVLQVTRAVEEGLNDMFEAMGRGDQDVKVKLNGLTMFIESIRMLPDLLNRARAGFEAFENTPGGLVEKLKAADEATRNWSPGLDDIRDRLRGVNEELQTEATNLEKTVTAMERNGEVHESESSRILKALEEVAKKAERLGVDLPESFDKMLAKYREMSGASQQRAQEAGTEATAVQQGAQRQEQAHEGVAQAQAKQSAGAKELAGAEQQAAAAAAGSTVAWNAQTKTLESVATAAGDAGAKVKEGAAKAGEGAASLQEVAAAGAAAGKGFEAVGAGAAGVGDGANKGKGGIDTFKATLADVTVMEAFKVETKKVEEVLQALNAVKLTELRTEIQAARQDVEQLAQALRDADAAAAAT